MSDFRENIELSAPFIEPPLPPLAYAVRLAHPLAPAIRALGFACVFLAAAHLARLPFLLMSANVSMRGNYFYDRNAYIVVFLLALLASLVNCIFQMIAGVGCIRSRPSAGKWLRIWAWSEIICSSMYVLANLYFQFHTPGRIYFRPRTFENAAWLIELWIISVTVPIFAIILLRSSSFSDAIASRS
jgi:hypothetical protein